MSSGDREMDGHGGSGCMARYGCSDATVTLAAIITIIAIPIVIVIISITSSTVVSIPPRPPLIDLGFRLSAACLESEPAAALHCMPM